jgi:hypothetical protein
LNLDPDPQDWNLVAETRYPLYIALIKTESLFGRAGRAVGHHLPVCGGAGPEPAPDPPVVDGGGHGAGQARLLARRRREDAQERSGLSSSMSISSDFVKSQGQCCGCGSA